MSGDELAGDIEPSDILAHTRCTSPDDVVDTLVRWSELAQQAGRQLSDLAAIVSVEEQGIETSMGPRSYWSKQLDGDDGCDAVRALLARQDDHATLLVLGSTPGRGEWSTTLDELRRGRELQKQAAHAGLN